MERYHFCGFGLPLAAQKNTHKFHSQQYMFYHLRIGEIGREPFEID
jgi:hypothetical protein